MPTWMGWGALALLVLQGVLLIALWMRRPAAIDAEQAIHAPLRDLERALRDELARTAQATRGDMAHLQQLLLAQGGDVARTQNEQIDSFRVQLGRLQETIEARLATLQEGNERKLEQMRATVDEKLHATLEQRLSESFRQVAERLEQVHRGLGEMQTLARDVGALQRVLSNVKARGVFGETQLAALIEEVLAPEQYARNVATLPGSSERVEFAVRLPGPRADGPPIWLPVDAKFPREDYERLVDAQERADVAAVEAAGKALEQRLRLEARRIREKYVGAPHTTDFAILFVPTEGLYAEALRRPGLVEGMQREHKIVLTGPTTLLATLSSLQMGFRTLALERRSAEVWEVLGAVKTEFGKFGDVLTRTRRKLEEATQTIDSAQQRTRAMERSLKQVEALPDAHAQLLLPGLAGGPDDAPAAAAGRAEERPLG
ncbi:MAG: DNA recombination protein RmuC [Rubrivivax sp.]|nr:DNA recombination protein RmuC [Rubrivivax sp.]